MKLLTKVAKGVAFGDVSNVAVRNVLTEISKRLYGGITEQEMEDTMDYFGWECPYTGIPLKNEIINKTGAYATDHIHPQNKDGCGLNAKGNLIIVSRDANKAKGGKSLKDFMENDSDFWTKLGIDKTTRMARLKKIEAFQKACGYDPDKIQKELSPFLTAYYDHIRDVQEQYIQDSLNMLGKVGITSTLKAPTAIPNTVVSSSATKKTKKSSFSPILEFTPADEQVFKSDLLRTKKAHFELTYASGKVVTTPWNASKFKATSNLRGNIESKTFWRNKDSEGLVKVEAFID